MARRYSKQQMQKLILPFSGLLTTGLQAVAVFTFDDECLVKRIRISATDSSPTSPPSGCKLYVCQVDDPSTADPVTDVDSEQRLVMFKFGQGSVNINETITMRKLAGSSVIVYADVVTGTHNYKIHSVLHYLES